VKNGTTGTAPLTKTKTDSMVGACVAQMLLRDGVCISLSWVPPDARNPMVPSIHVRARVDVDGSDGLDHDS
jgi:hypothetical protein